MHLWCAFVLLLCISVETCIQLASSVYVTKLRRWYKKLYASLNCQFVNRAMLEWGPKRKDREAGLSLWAYAKQGACKTQNL